MSVVTGPRSAGAAYERGGYGASERRSVQVPAVHRPTPRQLRLEGLIIFLIFAVAFGVFGYWVVVDARVVPFSSLYRLSNAYLTLHGTPPKLAAIGFTLPPLQSLVLLPFTIVSSMATSLVALPVCSAIFGGLAMVSINRLFARCDMSPGFRYPTLLLIALTPTVAFYAASGGAEVIALFMQAAAVSALIAWYRTVDTRYLITSGLAFAFATMTDYSSVVLMVLAAMMVATVLSRHGADDAEVEGSLITYVAPTIYALALWCLCNWLIVDSPFGWLTASSSTTVNVLHATGHSASAGTVFVDCLKLALAAAPLTLVVTPLLVAVAVIQGNELAGWLAAFSIATILRPGVDALIHHNVALMQMSLAMPTLLMSVVGAAWLFQSLPTLRPLIGVGLLAGLLASIALVWHGMATYPYQNMEQAFRTVVINGSSSTPAQSRDGLAVGIGQEQKMATYIDDHVTARGSILTDNSQTYGVILVSGDPALFATRLQSAHNRWNDDIVRPARAIKYFLITKGDKGDLINTSYSGAVSGDRNGLQVVFQDARYALLSVAPGTTLKNSVSHKRSSVSPGPVIAVNTSS